MDKVNESYKHLLQEWKKTPRNLKKIGELLDASKIILVKSSFIPVGDVKTSLEELKAARNILEIGVQYSIYSQDVASFERYVSQLKCYYYDYKKLLGESSEKYKMLGLNLLYLLSQNRVAEFHTELELLPVEIIQTDKYIRYPLALEQYIMEGRYNKIFMAKDNSPAEVYTFFIDKLLETVVNEIARCLEKSYETISLVEVAKRLNLKHKSDVQNFGEKRGWTLSKEGFYTFNVESTKQDDTFPSVELAEQSLLYAKELEMIV